MNPRANQQASEIIAWYLADLNVQAGNDFEQAPLLVDAHQAVTDMVQIFRLLTGHMPQAAGLDLLFTPDERPAMEWAAPTERDPNIIYEVITGHPDILKGDQDANAAAVRRQEAGKQLARVAYRPQPHGADRKY